MNQNPFEDEKMFAGQGAEAGEADAIESTDKNISASIGGVIGNVLVTRPQEGALYSLYFVTPGDAGEEREEIAFIGPDTQKAEKEFGQIVTFLRGGSWKTRTDAIAAVRGFIVTLHGGIQEAR
jgi:hypothetical protein